MKKDFLFTGSYNKSNSGGIEAFKWIDGGLEHILTETSSINPSYLAFNKDGSVLYAANELPQSAEITAYKMNLDGGRLSYINRVKTVGAGMCHIVLNEQETAIYGANYDSGNIVAFAINPDGSLGKELSNVVHNGGGPNPRQLSPHVHQVSFSPCGSWLLAVDLGADAVFSYKLAEDGAILADKCRKNPLPAGEGPRHLVFDADNETVYIITELKCSILRCRFDKKSGELAFEESMPIIEETKLTEDITGGEILLLKDFNTLCVSIRGKDEIYLFDKDSDGRLVNKRAFSSFGESPRMVSADGAGRYIFIANQVSGTLAVVEAESGQCVCRKSVSDVSFAELI